MGNYCCCRERVDAGTPDFKVEETTNKLTRTVTLRKLIVKLKNPLGSRGTENAEALMNTMKENWEVI